jgi:hypothetical protein
MKKTSKEESNQRQQLEKKATKFQAELSGHGGDNPPSSKFSQKPTVGLRFGRSGEGISYKVIQGNKELLRGS